MDPSPYGFIAPRAEPQSLSRPESANDPARYLFALYFIGAGASLAMVASILVYGATVAAIAAGFAGGAVACATGLALAEYGGKFLSHFVFSKRDINEISAACSTESHDRAAFRNTISFSLLEPRRLITQANEIGEAAPEFRKYPRKFWAFVVGGLIADTIISGGTGLAVHYGIRKGLENQPQQRIVTPHIERGGR